MKKFKQIIGWLFLLLLISCSEQRNSAQKITQTELQTGEYSDEVLLHLQSRARQLQLLFSSTLVINTLKTANQHAKSISPLTEKAYQDIDARMQRKSQTPDVQKLLYNDCAINLKAFRAKHPAFSEIFVTDLSGMNVCQTNMTTDFYQADEAWWKTAYNNGAGKLYFGSIEYDKSANEVSIPIYVPIYDNNELIGISKSVLSIDDIRSNHNHE